MGIKGLIVLCSVTTKCLKTGHMTLYIGDNGKRQQKSVQYYH